KCGCRGDRPAEGADQALTSKPGARSHGPRGTLSGAMTRVACCQIAPDVERPENNADKVQQAIAAAVADGAEIIVLPELASSGYVFRSVEEARAAAVPADGEVLKAWAEEADRGGAVVVCGFCELASDGRV